MSDDKELALIEECSNLESGNWGIEFPVFMQRDQLGIEQILQREDRATIKVLDIGCGPTGKLVNYLRSEGVSAEGADPNIRNPNAYLMKRGLEVNAKLPRPDGHYDVVLAHSLIPLWKVYSTFSEKVSKAKGEPFVQYPLVADDYVTASCILSEIFRLLKVGGSFVCYPELDKIENYRKIELNPPKFEAVGVDVIGETLAAIVENSFGREGVLRAMTRRSIIQKQA